MKHAFRRAATPLAFYYAVTLALPLANGAGGPSVLNHALVVLVLPPILILLFSLVALVPRPLRKSERPPYPYDPTRVGRSD